MTSTTIQIMQTNRNLEMKWTARFKSIFNRQLHGYMNYLTGFDIMKFDKDIETPDGISTRQWVQKKYGGGAVALIENLIQ